MAVGRHFWIRQERRMASGRLLSFQAWGLGVLAGALLVVVVLPVTLLASRQNGPPRTGKQIFEAACIQCHGANGTGNLKAAVGFEQPLPDLSDCNFTREADADWFAIVHNGGPVRAFSRLMPSFGEALTADEIYAVIGYVRTFCGSKAWPRGELNFPRAIITEKAFPEDEFLFVASASTGNPGEVGYTAIYEKRLGARSQMEVIVPFSSLEADAGGWSTNIGDVAFGAKSTLFHNRGSGTIFSAGLEVGLPTGNADRGFGSGHTTVEGFLAFGQGLPADGFIQAQTGLGVPTNGDPKEVFWRLVLGKTFISPNFGRAWSPMVEVVAAKELADGEAALWDIVPEFQVTLSRRQHIRLAFGAQVPLNERESRYTQVLAYFLWDWFDGGLFSAWK
jgi:mono/diheme cytochrome c family protein